MLEKFLKKSTLTDLIISIVFILFGAVLMANPNTIVSIISFIIGGIFIFIGVLKLIEFFSEGKQDNYKIAIAISAMILGVILMFCTGFILTAVRIVIGIWIIYSGIMNLQSTIIWKEYTSKAWILSCVLSVLIIIVGFFVLVSTGAILKTIGAVMIIYGIVNIVENLLFMKYINKEEK